MNNLTKILIGVVLVVILAGGSFLLYRYLAPGIPPPPPVQAPAGAFPESGNVSAPIAPSAPAVNYGSAPVPATGTSSASPSETNIKIISDKPVAGAVFIERQNLDGKTKTLVIRYIEKESGHISELAPGESLAQKISNTTITRVYQSLFGNKGESVMIRRADESGAAQNIMAAVIKPAPAATTSALAEDNIGKLNQSLLPQDIKEVAASPAGDKIFYLTRAGNGFVGTTESFGLNPKNKKQVFASLLGEWQVDWPAGNQIFLNTKPSAGVPGFLYGLNLNNGSQTKFLGNINGLTSNVSPLLKKLVYSESTPGGLNTYVYDLTKKEASPLTIKTLPEKCAWGGIDKDVLYCAVPSIITPADYPDSWYQGTVSFDDEIWKIDTGTGNAELLVDKSATARAGGLDASNLLLSPDENYLLLINKKDSSLCQIRLK